MSNEPEEMTDRKALAIFYREHKHSITKIAKLREAVDALLAACKAAVVAFPEDDGAIIDWKDDEARRVIRQIKAAIAKAEQA